MGLVTEPVPARAGIALGSDSRWLTARRGSPASRAVSLSCRPRPLVACAQRMIVRLHVRRLYRDDTAAVLGGDPLLAPDARLATIQVRTGLQTTVPLVERLDALVRAVGRRPFRERRGNDNHNVRYRPTGGRELSTAVGGGDPGSWMSQSEPARAVRPSGCCTRSVERTRPRSAAARSRSTPMSSAGVSRPELTSVGRLDDHVVLAVRTRRFIPRPVGARVC